MQCCAQAFVSPQQVVVGFGGTRFVTLTPPLAFAPVVRTTERGPQVARAARRLNPAANPASYSSARRA